MDVRSKIEHGKLFVHTRMYCLSDGFKEQLKPFTVSPSHDSFMLGLLNDMSDDPKRVSDVHVFLLFDEALPLRNILAWAVSYEAVWSPDLYLHRDCNEVSIFVRPEQRGKGYSTQLLNYAMDQIDNGRMWAACPDDDVARSCFSKLGIIDVTGWIGVSIIEETETFE